MREFETKPTQTFIKAHSSKLIALAIACVAAALYLPYLSAAHLFDWDEINFAECAREMILTKNYTQPQINFQPFYEKYEKFWRERICCSIPRCALWHSDISYRFFCGKKQNE
jgi:hypothetical protein